MKGATPASVRSKVNLLVYYNKVSYFLTYSMFPLQNSAAGYWGGRYRKEMWYPQFLQLKPVLGESESKAVCATRFRVPYLLAVDTFFPHPWQSFYLAKTMGRF